MAGYFDVDYRLTQSGANFEIRNGKLWSPLDCACANGYPKAAQTLLEAGASVEPKGRVKVCKRHFVTFMLNLFLINFWLSNCILVCVKIPLVCKKKLYSRLWLL